MMLVRPLTVPAVPSIVTGLPVAASPTLMVLASASCTPSVVVVLVTLASPLTLIVSPSANLFDVAPSPKLMPLAMLSAFV